MSAPKRLLVLHDSLDFGGHERAFLTWLPALLASTDVATVTLSFPEANETFAQALAPFAGPKLRLRPGRFAKRRAEPFLAPVRLPYRRWIRELAGEARPDVVLLLQGRIENLSVAMLALPSEAELVSYVPMAHSGREMGRPALTAWPPDRVKRLYYGRPDRFIVPSSAVADQLRRTGARGAVHVVRNVPETRRIGAPARDPAPSSKRSALFLGRIEARQKGLDLLVRSMELERDRLEGWDFHFIGDGPDADWLNARLAALPEVSGRISSWTEEPRAALAAADLVLMPSRYEGVPLVLLEALADDVPVLGSPIDVFREHLPPANLFAFGGPGLAASMQAATDPAGRSDYQAHARRLGSDMDVERSRSGFVAAVLGAASNSSSNLDGAQ